MESTPLVIVLVVVRRPSSVARDLEWRAYVRAGLSVRSWRWLVRAARSSRVACSARRAIVRAYQPTVGLAS